MIRIRLRASLLLNLLIGDDGDVATLLIGK